MKEAATYYTSARMMLNEYLNMGIYANNMMLECEWLPYSELDVNAKVYAELSEREFDRDDNTMPLEDFIAELRAIAAKAPKRADVVIELGTGGYDDDHHATYEIGYWREPTKKERAEREETNRKIRERDALAAERAEAKERAEFERLQAKFAPR